MKENEEINDIKNIVKDITKIYFNKPKSEPDNKFFDNVLLFDLYYRYNEKPEWMKNGTKRIINNKKRINNEIVDHVEYITSAEVFADKGKNIEKILKECISKEYKAWNVLKFGNDTQGISDVFSDLDFEIIPEKKN